MKYVVTINEQKFEVEVERGKATLLESTPAAVPEAAQPQASISAAAAPAADAQGEPVFAPMPGVIIQVKAPAGTAVTKGQPLLVLEAMKMENEIVSVRDGIVTSTVARGTRVATGEILALIA